MPFEFGPVSPLKIAVIGGGISGMGAAHLLAKAHNVTLFESEKRLGGHARTVMAGKSGEQPVDTGFIVFNYQNYPNMAKLFEFLDVPVTKSDMTFAVSMDNERTEYGLKDLAAIRHTVVQPRMWSMFKDLAKFNRGAEAAVRPDMTLNDLMDAMGLGEAFRKYYLLPFSGAIWSTPINQMLDFPAEALMRFFRNHNLLATYGQHQWYTVEGGSIQYVTRLERELRNRGADVRLDAPIKSVMRDPNGVSIRPERGAWEYFDKVIFACHSDQVLEMLQEPTAEESRLLGAIKYQPNRAVLHRDPVVMPKRKQCWASWVYKDAGQDGDAPLGVSYWMNSLQPIPKSDPIFQSLNPTSAIRDELIYEETNFAHPVFDRAALAAQSGIREIQGLNNTSFCGAYLRNGFHEDGYFSALEVAESLGMLAEWR